MRTWPILLAIALAFSPGASASHEECAPQAHATYDVVPGVVYFHWWFQPETGQGDFAFWLESNGMPGLQTCESHGIPPDTRF